MKVTFNSSHFLGFVVCFLPALDVDGQSQAIDQLEHDPKAALGGVGFGIPYRVKDSLTLQTDEACARDSPCLFRSAKSCFAKVSNV
jgi:hypothetical protein